MFNSLSDRLLILTVIFVMLAEVLIFVPSIARFRQDYMLARLERAQIASLTLLADDMIDDALEAELLRNAEVFNVVLRRDEVRQLVLASPMPQTISQTYDLRDASAFTLIQDAVSRLVKRENEVIRVIDTLTLDPPLTEAQGIARIALAALILSRGDAPGAEVARLFGETAPHEGHWKAIAYVRVAWTTHEHEIAANATLVTLAIPLKCRWFH